MQQTIFLANVVEEFRKSLSKIGTMTHTDFDKQFHETIWNIEKLARNYPKDRKKLIDKFMSVTTSDFESSSVSRHSRIKPLGYAGDHLLIDMIYPSVNHLFISKNGTPVTYSMLYEGFAKIRRHPDKPEDLAKLHPYMLRHAFATYFVYNAMVHKGTEKLGHAWDLQIDEELRRYMGHSRSDTTYKFYVHLAERLSSVDVMGDFMDEALGEFCFETV